MYYSKFHFANSKKNIYIYKDLISNDLNQIFVISHIGFLKTKLSSDDFSNLEKINFFTH